MSRTCFLSAGGDPFLLSFVLQLFQKHWYDEVDKVYVNFNNHAGVPLNVVQKCLIRITEDPKIVLIYHPQGIGNGMPITEMTLLAKEELVMLLEDDGFIFTKGKVNECFQRIEKDQCDAVGSPRRSCGQEIWDASQKKYNLDYSGYGDCGPCMWPNTFFCKRNDLLRTDMNFGSKAFLVGEYSKELDHTFKENNYADTFGWGLIQLRYLGLRFYNIPQFHASPTEPEDKEQKVMNWINGIPYWIHGGSLSSGWGGYLQNQVPDVSTESAKREIETRVAFWKIASDITEGFDSFKEEYKKGIASLIYGANLEYSRIQEKYNLYRELMKV